MMIGIKKLIQSYGAESFDDELKQIFPTFLSISIDYGIMEKAEKVWTIPANFGWDDVGSWLALERILLADENNNAAIGNVVNIDSKDVIVHGGVERLVAVVGIKNIIVVDAGDAVLICNKEQTQDVKKVVEYLKKNNKAAFL
jgi:mannose-1-phosphate guanylyltransferase